MDSMSLCLRRLFRMYYTPVHRIWMTLFGVTMSALSVALALFDSLRQQAATLRCLLLILHALVTGMLFVPLCSKTFRQTMNAKKEATLCTLFILNAFILVTLMLPWKVSWNLLTPNEPKTVYADAIWSVVLCIVMMMLLLPLKFYISFGVAILLGGAYIAIDTVYSSFNVPLTQTWKTIVVNVDLILCVTVVCSWLNLRMHQVKQTAFSHAKSCAESRIILQNTQDRCERLMQIVYPKRVVSQLARAFLQKQNAQEKRFLHPTKAMCTLIQVDLCGTSQLVQLCQPMEFLRMLNCLVASFDSLSEQLKCYRVRLVGSGYFAVCGLPDPVHNHAQCAVQFAFNVIDTVKQFQEETGVKFGAKVAVHSDNVVAAVFGCRRTGYDLWCEHLASLSALRCALQDDQVGVSRNTLAELGSLFLSEQLQNLPSECKFDAFLLRPRSKFGAHRSTARPQRLFSSLIHSGRQNYANCPTPPPSFGRASGRKAANNSGGLNGVDFNEMPFSDINDILLADQTGPSNHPDSDRPPGGNASNYRCIYPFDSTDTLQQCLEHALKMQSVSKMRASSANAITLRLHNARRETAYATSTADNFTKSVLWVLFILLCNVLVQALALAHTVFLIVLVITTLVWNGAILLAIVAAKLKWIRFDLRKSSFGKLILTVFTVVIFHTLSQLNVLQCQYFVLPQPAADPLNATTVSAETAAFTTVMSLRPSVYRETNDEIHRCMSPTYVYMNCLFTFLLIAVFEFTALLKLVLMGLISVVYVVIIEFHNGVAIHEYDIAMLYAVPSYAYGSLLLASSMIVLYVHSRYFEWFRRVQFIWCCQMDDAIQSTTIMHNKISDSLYNLMPEHALAYFLDTRYRNPVDFYCVPYKQVGVVFCSIAGLNGAHIPNTHADKTDPSIVKSTILDQLFTMFDNLLASERYQQIEKVKSFGDSYQFAVGVTEDESDLQLPDLLEVIEVLKEFTLKITEVNQRYGTHLFLSSSLCVGPCFSGVCGAKRAQFDLFGSTVVDAFWVEKQATKIVPSNGFVLLVNGDARKFLDPYFRLEKATVSSRKLEVEVFRFVGMKPITDGGHPAMLSSSHSERTTQPSRQPASASAKQSSSCSSPRIKAACARMSAASMPCPPQRGFSHTSSVSSVTTDTNEKNGCSKRECEKETSKAEKHNHQHKHGHSHAHKHRCRHHANANAPNCINNAAQPPIPPTRRSSQSSQASHDPKLVSRRATANDTRRVAALHHTGEKKRTQSTGAKTDSKEEQSVTNQKRELHPQSSSNSSAENNPVDGATTLEFLELERACENALYTAVEMPRDTKQTAAPFYGNSLPLKGGTRRESASSSVDNDMSFPAYRKPAPPSSCAASNSSSQNVNIMSPKRSRENIRLPNSGSAQGLATSPPISPTGRVPAVPDKMMEAALASPAGPFSLRQISNDSGHLGNCVPQTPASLDDPLALLPLPSLNCVTNHYDNEQVILAAERRNECKPTLPEPPSQPDPYHNGLETGNWESRNFAYAYQTMRSEMSVSDAHSIISEANSTWAISEYEHDQAGIEWQYPLQLAPGSNAGVEPKSQEPVQQPQQQPAQQQHAAARNQQVDSNIRRKFLFRRKANLSRGSSTTERSEYDNLDSDFSEAVHDREDETNDEGEDDDHHYDLYDENTQPNAPEQLQSSQLQSQPLPTQPQPPMAYAGEPNQSLAWFTESIAALSSEYETFYDRMTDRNHEGAERQNLLAIAEQRAPNSSGAQPKNPMPQSPAAGPLNKLLSRVAAPPTPSRMPKVNGKPAAENRHSIAESVETYDSERPSSMNCNYGTDFDGKDLSSEDEQLETNRLRKDSGIEQSSYDQRAKVSCEPTRSLFDKTVPAAESIENSCDNVASLVNDTSENEDEDLYPCFNGIYSDTENYADRETDITEDELSSCDYGNYERFYNRLKVANLQASKSPNKRLNMKLTYGNRK